MFLICSNGLRDPWSSGGVVKSISDSVISVLIPEGAHHLDLRGSNPLDPKSVIDARNVHRENIKKWINKASNQVTERNELNELGLEKNNDLDGVEIEILP